MTGGAFWRTVTRFESAKVQSWMAVRNALGVALPLAMGAAMGDVGGGLVASTGALNVAFSDGADPYLRRAKRMLLSSILCALAVFAGGLTGHLHGIAIAEAAAWAFAAGMMVTVSTTAADIGSVTLIVLLVFSARQMSPIRALIAGLLSLAGGLLQTAMAVALWPVSPRTPERKALATLYLELARAAAAGAPPSEAPPVSAQMSAAQTALETLSGDRSLEAERYLGLLSQAERIRLAIVALARLRRSAEAARFEVSRTLALASEVLGVVGASLDSGAPAAPRAESVAELRELREQLRARPSTPLLRDAIWQIEALSGQLRSALDLAAHVTPQGAGEFERLEAARPWRLRLAGVVALLRANLTLNSTAFRHAVRLSVCVVIGTLIGHLLDWRHSYWLPMTIAIVLKPDFTATFSRGVQRLAGTAAGLVLATGLFHFIAPGVAAEVAMIAIFAFLLRWAGPANYGVLVTGLTSLVVLMFAAVGSPPAQVMPDRAWNTAAGGLIALAAYWLWPTWERTQISETIAALFDAYRAYFQAVTAAYLEPQRSFADRLDRARKAGRLARSNLEASAARLRGEPRTPPSQLKALDALLANSHRFVHAAMSLEAGLAISRPVPARDAFRVLASHVDLTLYYLASSLRGSLVAAADFPDLREDHHALATSGDPGVDRYALVNVETDRIANSLNTLKDEVLAWKR